MPDEMDNTDLLLHFLTIKNDVICALVPKRLHSRDLQQKKNVIKQWADVGSSVDASHGAFWEPAVGHCRIY